MHRWVSLIEENREDIARLMSSEGGKPLA
ncbi:hypothetical protein [Pantoea septica]